MGLTTAIPRVRWFSVDPCWVRRPKGNYVRARIYEGWDFVPWSPVTWSLRVREEILLPVAGISRPWGLDDRGRPLSGRLLRFRQHSNGFRPVPVGLAGDSLLGYPWETPGEYESQPVRGTPGPGWRAVAGIGTSSVSARASPATSGYAGSRLKVFGIAVATVPMRCVTLALRLVARPAMHISSSQE